MSSIKLRISRTLAMMPWIRTADLAQQVRRDRTVVLRHLRRLGAQYLVADRLCGRPPAQFSLWLLTADGSYFLYPDRHVHPRFHDGSVHNPAGLDVEPHSHPSFWNSLRGAQRLFESRRHLFGVLYPLAIFLFRGAAREYSGALPDGTSADLIAFRWLRGGRLVVAVGEYQGGINAFFMWVPQEFTEMMLRQRWAHRFTGLLTRAENGLAPRPSVFVLIAEDEKAFLMASKVLVEGMAWYEGARPAILYCPPAGLWLPQGEILPSTDNVWDPFGDQKMGEPASLCDPLPEEEDDHGE